MMPTERESREPIQIMLVEDTMGDVELTLEALEEGRISNKVEVLRNGEEAIAYLERSRNGEVPRPDLILLDLNLPRMDGREVLQRLKNDTDFRRIPVIVLTTSKAEADVLHAYDLHANSYVTKPVLADEFIHAVQAVENYWLSIVTLPKR